LTAPTRCCDDRLSPGKYVSLAFGQAARDAGIARSMGSKGDCYDNAVAESFFATLKKELVHRHSWPTRRELTTEVFEYIEAFYNRTRRHSRLGMLSPADYEAAHAPLACAGAREKSVHNSEDACSAFGLGLTECTTDPGWVSVSKDVSSGSGRRHRSHQGRPVRAVVT